MSSRRLVTGRCMRLTAYRVHTYEATTEETSDRARSRRREEGGGGGGGKKKKHARAGGGGRKPAGSRGSTRGWQGGGGGYAGAVFFKLYRKLPAARCAARDTTRTRQPLPAVMACYATSSPPTTTADSYSIPSDVRIPAYSYVLRKRGRTCSRVSRDSLLADRATMRVFIGREAVGGQEGP